ncbi:hypothetical protein LZ31DRAFT_555702 [Colletotrichum somersetense]|nr:hypothetical protein LZ31DRAFT_555702 [Colletotrichum somersetense]
MTLSWCVSPVLCSRFCFSIILSPFNLKRKPFWLRTHLSQTARQVGKVPIIGTLGQRIFVYGSSKTNPATGNSHAAVGAWDVEALDASPSIHPSNPIRPIVRQSHDPATIHAAQKTGYPLLTHLMWA